MSSVSAVEDPVTGSAHCALATYWAGRLDKTEFRAYQASARGGVLGVRLVGDRLQRRLRAMNVTPGIALVKQIEQAAQLRAEGRSWEVIAKRLGLMPPAA
jgi:hypothetical protein